MIEGAHTDFAERLLRWHRRHGRRDLPWQREPSAYRVWVSEVMLQQTRVATAAGYFDRFMERFPDVTALAGADLDAVLQLWSGLGYYARARNLHRAARQVRDRHAGRVPLDVDALQALPGVGRSTAAAILALAAGRRHAILDGNAKRVLARYFGVEGWPGKPAVERRLWALAEALTPRAEVAAYTQAMMDLGATLCVRSQPRCTACPLAEGCAARRDGRTAELPARRARRDRPSRHVQMLVLVAGDGLVLLERRPPAGVWGGLWSLPECPPGTGAAAWCREQLGLNAVAVTPLAPLRHELTHIRLQILPLRVQVEGGAGRLMEGGRYVWYKSGLSPDRGLAAPVRRLLARVQSRPHGGAMTRMVKCVKLGAEAEGLDRPPYPGELGRRIYENISKEAWRMWLDRQTMLINEYRLTPFEPQARAFLEQQMEQFLFGEGAVVPEGYVPPER